MAVDRVVRDRLVSQLLEQAERSGKVPEFMVDAAANAAGCSARTVWRWLAASSTDAPEASEASEQPARAGFELTEEHLVVLAARRQVKAAWRDL